jgi:hypothetical protein
MVFLLSIPGLIFLHKFKIREKEINIVYLFLRWRNKRLELSEISLVRLELNSRGDNQTVIFYDKNYKKYKIHAAINNTKVLEAINELKIPIYVNEDISNNYQKKLERIREKGIEINVVNEFPK